MIQRLAIAAGSLAILVALALAIASGPRGAMAFAILCVIGFAMLAPRVVKK